jgi:hypothetical protein
VVRNLLIFLLLTGFGLPESVSAQDLEPRRWSHLPIGQNIVGVGYVYTEANIFFSPVLKITDGTSRINSLGFSAIHTFDLAGKSARFSLLLPYVSGRWDGDVDGRFQVIHRQGGGDPRLRLSMNLYGAPPLKGPAFAQYREEHTTSTVAGASIAVTVPIGKYCDDCLINIGNNRWSVRPQIGVVHTRGHWSFELTGSAFVFTDNDSFIDNAVLKQKPVYALQTHVIYDFKPGLWVSLSTGYGTGGRIQIDQQKTKFEVDNWVWAASFGFPIGKTQSLKLTWLSGRSQNLVGRDSDNLLLSWSMRWGH